MLQNKNLIFDLFIRKIRKNYNGAYGKNLKILFNCHNFRCVQDKVVM